MHPRNLFLLAVRILGLVFLYRGLMVLPTTLFGAFTSLLYGAAPSFFGMGFMALWPLALAGWLIRGAPFLIKLAYPSESARQEPGNIPIHQP